MMFQGKAGSMLVLSLFAIVHKPLYLLKPVCVCYFSAFFHTFGTHFMSAVYLGGKVISQITLDEQTCDNLKQSGKSVQAAAEVSLKGKGSVSASGGVASTNSAEDGLGTTVG